ncbi:hypothetical protein BRPE64_ACDS19540 [Caballeronia insecticola]|uniref:Uncharacterized protein n=1 Tax=Caballeronia insecticola TaxID=758793 RepID=R4WHM8_9BURK|nr:hypothetical protein BRPE64_ACDS19540 [Caballeronia insecticola]
MTHGRAVERANAKIASNQKNPLAKQLTGLFGFYIISFL